MSKTARLLLAIALGAFALFILFGRKLFGTGQSANGPNVSVSGPSVTASSAPGSLESQFQGVLNNPVAGALAFIKDPSIAVKGFLAGAEALANNPGMALDVGRNALPFGIGGGESPQDALKSGHINQGTYDFLTLKNLGRKG